MKNVISYYYNLNPNAIHQFGKTFKFEINSINYILTPCYFLEEIDNIFELSNDLIRQGILVHQIILNNNNQVVTNVNDTYYVLMKIMIKDRGINLNDIVKFNNNSLILRNYPKLRRDNWYDLWCNKVDYFEYQVNQLGKKYPLIRDSFSYYVGLAENGICLFKLTNNQRIAINHRRILKKDTLYDLYNPFNLVIDYRIRDICEYFKSCFFNNIDIYEDVRKYIYGSNFDHNEKILFMARMLFPTFYFDVYEKIMANLVSEEEIRKITEKVDDYEYFLKRVYMLLKDNQFPIIDWLER